MSALFHFPYRVRAADVDARAEGWTVKTTARALAGAPAEHKATKHAELVA